MIESEAQTQVMVDLDAAKIINIALPRLNGIFSLYL
jgi:hypothetical protein